MGCGIFVEAEWQAWASEILCIKLNARCHLCPVVAVYSRFGLAETPMGEPSKFQGVRRSDEHITGVQSFEHSGSLLQLMLQYNKYNK